MLALRLIGLVIPLGLDTFAVSAAVGMGDLTRQQRLKLSMVFALFEAGTPIVGLLLGVPLGHALGSVADYVAGGILIAYGLFSLLRRENEGEGASRLVDARGTGLLLLGLSVSLDELAIGFTLGLLHVPVIPVLVLIAVQTVVVSQLGIRLGTKLSERFRERAERLAALVLALLGVGVVVQRLVL
jgi:putative Mn2+ efflux pump MntP